MDTHDITEASTRLIVAMNKRYQLVSRLRTKLEECDIPPSEPLLEHLREAEIAFEKIVARMWFLTSRVRGLTSTPSMQAPLNVMDEATRLLQKGW